MQIKFSLIIPVYNTEKYLEKNINSIINQSYDNFEAIYLNDGSKDYSLKILKKYQKIDKRIKVIDKKNTGVSDTRNTGINKSTGDYICFVDSDDYLDKDFLKQLNDNIINNNNPELVKIKAISIDEDDKIVAEEIYSQGISNESGFEAFQRCVEFKYTIDSPWAFCYNAIYWKNNKFYFKIGTFHEDFGLIPEVLVKSKKVSFCEAKYYYLVNRVGSTMNNKDEDFIWKKANDLLKNYDSLYKNVILQNFLTRQEKCFFKHYIDNSAVLRLHDLNKEKYNLYKKELKKRGIYKFNYICNFKLLVKKIILNLNSKKYIEIVFNISKDKKKVLFISSTGGHLEELTQLKDMFKKYDYYIVTEKTKSNLKMREKYLKRVSFLVYGSYTTLFKKITYPFKLLINSFLSLFIFIKVRPKYIVSTGAHTAGPMCCIGKLFGSKIIFIETFANSKTKSRTGRLVYKFADLFIVQWEEMLELYPNAVYGGWIF